MDITFDMFIETEVPEDQVIISRTDLKGIITYVNDTFAEISGYSPEELIGKPHNILRHPDMPKSAFKEMWETIKAEKTWEGYVKNMRKDRGYYWVYAVISGVYKEGKVVEYKSIRSPVPRTKRIEMQRVYDEMRRKEGENVRSVMYLSVETYEKLKARADSEEKSVERLIDDIV
ncbi:PAS domain-containing protein [Hydrogenimonas urashimensis]|uniref:PAS domain-containing protein n=1 Tax=Hydrogenimonas urashimensis TaxID=2740515 RepID=UPI001915EA3D|nr:PAS domain-containing protein [Hydrogenimonas urashimensis]